MYLKQRGSIKMVFFSVLLVCAVVALGLILHFTQARPFPKLELSPAHQGQLNPCAQKETCLLVYLAPWCGYCKKSVPVVRELAQRWQGASDKGMRVVVGMAQADQVQEMVAELGDQVYVETDPQRSLATKIKDLGYTGVPHWFVLNEQGLLTDELSGYAPLNDILNALGLD